MKPPKYITNHRGEEVWCVRRYGNNYIQDMKKHRITARQTKNHYEYKRMSYFSLFKFKKYPVFGTYGQLRCSLYRWKRMSYPE